MKEDDEEESMNGEEFLFGNTEMGVRYYFTQQKT